MKTKNSTTKQSSKKFTVISDTRVPKYSYLEINGTKQGDYMKTEINATNQGLCIAVKGTRVIGTTQKFRVPTIKDALDLEHRMWKVAHELLAHNQNFDPDEIYATWSEEKYPKSCPF